MRAEHAGASGRADPGDLYTAQPRERHRPANAGSAIGIPETGRSSPRGVISPCQGEAHPAVTADGLAAFLVS